MTADPTRGHEAAHVTERPDDSLTTVLHRVAPSAEAQSIDERLAEIGAGIGRVIRERDTVLERLRLARGALDKIDRYADERNDVHLAALVGAARDLLWSEFGDGYRAGLAVGLDVERLATALMAYNDPGENDRTAATLGLYRKRARAIAAEYARLTPERPAG